MKLKRWVENLLAGKWVELMHAGKYNGKEISVENLRAMADNYNPEYRVAPLVIGHPNWLGLDGERESHGEISQLRVVGDMLQAKFVNLSSTITEGLKAGKWINRSLEAFTDDPLDSNKSHSDEDNKGGWYLVGLAVLGGSQPAVPAMLSKDRQTLCINCDDSQLTEIENTQTILTEGASSMDEAQVQALITAATKPLNDQIAKLSAQTHVSPEEFAQMQEKVKGFDALSEETKNLKTELAATKNTAAQSEVDQLFAGVPKGLFDDEYRKSCLAAAVGNRDLFKTLAAPVLAAKGKFAYLTQELVKEDGDDAQSVNADVKRAPVSAKADPNTINVSNKAAALRAKDPNLSIEESVKLASKAGA